MVPFALWHVDFCKASVSKPRAEHVLSNGIPHQFNYCMEGQVDVVLSMEAQVGVDFCMEAQVGVDFCMKVTMVSTFALKVKLVSTIA